MDYSIQVKNLKLDFGSVHVLKSLDLDVSEGEFIVLLGSSGCGKSTLLNCIAGLLDITDGQIFIKGKNVTWAEPSQRGIGMVFQSYALYPQMTVRGNLSFGLQNARMPKDEIAKRVKRASEILQIEALLDRKPAALSGGQRQRVAIGRALVRDVDVFLFDEPLSNLDAKLRSDLRVEIKRLHQRLKNTMVYVTHDQVEAMTLADRIAIMRDGMILQLDTPHAVYNRPVNLYVAGFIGSPAMNFLKGSIADGSSVVKLDGVSVPMNNYAFDSKPTDGQNVVLGIRPEHISVGADAAKASFQFEAEIEIVEPMGSEQLAYTRLAGQPVTIRCSSDIPMEAGQKINLGFDVARGSLFDATSEMRL
ncbi:MULTISPECIES: ABC transporter ATP-binding protein [Devosia]|uniref:sn-glycerol-3-phosphate import ATP-binding protein UgpC n=1 Tax=Devosia equisanguinis TaxID=2490941 RepID=A0A3S5D3M0_9HYPH|nr:MULTISPECIES: ABC transporter ATP-binding protein [Devosia]ODT49128.1 MAG: ABC transporter ATP-binding protein [Pelagibacterium sp. SCN 63-126]ODU80207.1 MAG: ABC transporter ATP-binding protein [Pelagibacterium sp. SCN 63-17]OJX43354.1 MAG: ABC transporter ATP-binding protein [Devosia sp. 63-57]VDS06112.1 sn-glycerol-3-phosphate import ATP-binding protein UgpC [Devosia equisanguinis]